MSLYCILKKKYDQELYFILFYFILIYHVREQWKVKKKKKG